MAVFYRKKALLRCIYLNVHTLLAISELYSSLYCTMYRPYCPVGNYIVLSSILVPLSDTFSDGNNIVLIKYHIKMHCSNRITAQTWLLSSVTLDPVDWLRVRESNWNIKMLGCNKSAVKAYTDTIITLVNFSRAKDVSAFGLNCSFIVSQYLYNSVDTMSS